jgi:hypothetical protein
MNNELEMDLQKSYSGLVEVLSRYLSGLTEKIHEKHQTQ